MRYYVFLKKFVPLIVILYFIIGNLTWGVFRLEIFPVFSWELFSLVPNIETDYGLQITSINGTALDSPTYYQDLPDEFSESDSIIAFFVIQDLGEAIEADNEDAVQSLRNQVETIFLSAKSEVEYTVVKRTYYPRERWQTGLFEEEVEVKSYAK